MVEAGEDGDARAAVPWRCRGDRGLQGGGSKVVEGHGALVRPGAPAIKRHFQGHGAVELQRR